MITVKVEGANILATELEEVKRRFPSLIAKALTMTALDAKKDVVSEMPSIFDRPTPWTLRSVFVFPAEKTDLRAAVALKRDHGRTRREFMDEVIAPRSLRAQVFGGQRPLKESEKTLQRPGASPKGRPYIIPMPGVPLDQYGNVPNTFMNKVLYSGMAGGTVDGTAIVGRKSRMSAATSIYYTTKKGIFERSKVLIGGGLNANIHGHTRRLFGFSSKAEYKPRFDFYGIASRSINSHLGKRLGEGISVGLQRLRR